MGQMCTFDIYCQVYADGATNSWTLFELNVAQPVEGKNADCLYKLWKCHNLFCATVISMHTIVPLECEASALWS